MGRGGLPWLGQTWKVSLEDRGVMSEERGLDDRLLDPCAMDRDLRGADIQTISVVFERARSRGQRAWMTMAVCVGHAQAQAGRGDAVIERMADLFGLHRSRIARLGRIYREALLPRLEAEETPRFPLAEQAWYEIATEAALPLGRSASDLLAEAERRKREDPRYSTRRWKLDLGITSADPDSTKLRGLLLRLIGVEDDVVEEFAQQGLDGNRELLQAASRILDRASRASRSAGRRLLCRSFVDSHGDLLIEEVSAELAAQLGQTPAGLIGRSLFELIWNADHGRIVVDQLVRGETPSGDRGPFEIGRIELRHASGVKAILPLDYVVRHRSDGTLEGIDLVPADPSDRSPAKGSLPCGLGTHDRWVLSHAGHTLWVTDAIARALGESPGGMLGAPFWEFLVDPPHAKSLWEILRANPLSSSAGQELERASRSLCRRGDGTPLELGLELTFLLGAGPSWKGAVLSPPLAILHDRLAPEVRPVSRRMEPRMFLEQTLAMWVVDDSLRTIFVSPEIAALLQSTPESMSNRSALDFAPEPARWRTLFDRMRGGVAPPVAPGWRPGAIQVRRRDGQLIDLPLQTTRHYSPLGSFLGVTLYTSSVEIADEPPVPIARPTRDAMWIVRATDLETLFVSAELAELLGSTADEMVGRSALPFLKLAGDTVRATEDLRRSEVLWAGHSGLRQFVRADGHPLTLHIESYPVHDARGALTHIAAVFASAPRNPSP